MNISEKSRGDDDTDSDALWTRGAALVPRFRDALAEVRR
jgi:hypothetical protein